MSSLILSITFNTFSKIRHAWLSVYSEVYYHTTILPCSLFDNILNSLPTVCSFLRIKVIKSRIWISTTGITLFSLRMVGPFLPTCSFCHKAYWLLALYMNTSCSFEKQKGILHLREHFYHMFLDPIFLDPCTFISSYNYYFQIRTNFQFVYRIFPNFSSLLFNVNKASLHKIITFFYYFFLVHFGSV